MTREQAKQNLIVLGNEAPTDEQITNYLNQVNGETQKEKDKVTQYKEKAEKFDATQAELEAEKLKSMTAEEKLAAAEKAANEKAAEFNRKSNRLEVEKILTSSGLTEDQFKDIVDRFVGDDLETSKAAATAFTTLISAQREAATQKTKEELMNNTGTPGGGKGGNEGDTKTPAEIFAESMASGSSESAKTSTSILESYK